jgi:aerotaxis receptor
MRKNLPVTGRRISLPENANILSTTDPDSRITYVNPDFIATSGFTESELLGQPHNLIRHPDMPEAAFKHMWATLKSGKSWMGLVKNRCKNGDHYWVSAYVTPITQQGKTREYQSVRTAPEPAQVQAAEAGYARLRNGQGAAGLPGLSFSVQLMLVSAGAALAASTGVALLTGGGLATAISAGVAAGVGAAAAAGLMLAPLRTLVHKVSRDTHNPLSQKLYTGRTDELGQIEFAMQMARAETGAVIGRIGDSADQLGQLVKQLLADIDTSVSRTSSQSAETEQVAAAINEMAASIEEVAASAMNASRAAAQAATQTQDGQKMVAATSDSINTLEAEIQAAASVIEDLQGNTHQISQVLDVIRAIADQTNLLALNAAIEAARAGEQGRGFAVVADEVRSLAGRTQQSTSDIQDMISTLQQGAASAVDVMRASRDKARQSVSHAENAAMALVGIGEKVNQISEMNAQIATAVEQQSAVSEEINRSIIHIRDSAHLNAETGRTNQTSAQNVSRLSEALHELAKQFWAKRG